MYSTCTISGTRSFKNTTGATYPILLDGWSATGGNFFTLYGTWDNYIVVNKTGIVRYHARLIHAHGDAYHVNEIRATVDSLIDMTVGVPPAGGEAGWRLSAGPSPFTSSTTVTFVNPSGGPVPLRVSVFDLAGRRLASLHDGLAPGGISRFAWDGRAESGQGLAPGVYVIVADSGTLRLERRVVLLE